jgi:hypothetical protein
MRAERRVRRPRGTLTFEVTAVQLRAMRADTRQHRGENRSDML